jgi:hypothetical protein
MERRISLPINRDRNDNDIFWTAIIRMEFAKNQQCAGEYPMTHEHYQQRISLYIDNALNDKESAELFAHLSGCPDCRIFMKLTTRVHAQIAEEELSEVPSSLDRRVLASVAMKSAQAGQRSWYAPMWFTRISIPLPAAASILFLIIVGSLLFSPIISQEPQHRIEIPAPLESKIPSALQKQLELNK